MVDRDGSGFPHIDLMVGDLDPVGRNQLSEASISIKNI